MTPYLSPHLPSITLCCLSVFFLLSLTVSSPWGFYAQVVKSPLFCLAPTLRLTLSVAVVALLFFSLYFPSLWK